MIVVLLKSAMVVYHHRRLEDDTFTREMIKLDAGDVDSWEIESRIVCADHDAYGEAAHENEPRLAASLVVTVY